MNGTWLDRAAQVPLFEGIDEGGLKAIAHCMNLAPVKYKRGELIALEGRDDARIGVLLSGQAHLIREWMDGELLVMQQLGSGDVFGEMAAFQHKTWPATVEARADCEVLLLDPLRVATSCANACHGHNRMLLNLLGIMASQGLALQRQVRYLAIRSLRARLATFLLEQSHLAGKDTFVLPMARAPMAAFLGVARPSLSREMGAMRQAGWIDFHGAAVKILDKPALIRQTEE